MVSSGDSTLGPQQSHPEELSEVTAGVYKGGQCPHGLVPSSLLGNSFSSHKAKAVMFWEELPRGHCHGHFRSSLSVAYNLYYTAHTFLKDSNDIFRPHRSFRKHSASPRCFSVSMEGSLWAQVSAPTELCAALVPAVIFCTSIRCLCYLHSPWRAVSETLDLPQKFSALLPKEVSEKDVCPKKRADSNTV